MAHRRFRRRPALVGSGILLAVASLLTIAAWLQLRAALDDLNAARDAIAAAEDHARDGDIDDARASVTEAERRLSEARATIRSSAPLRIARVVPVVRQNIDAAQALTDRAFDLAASARRLADIAAPLAEDGGVLGQGGLDVESLAEIRAVSSVIRAEVNGFDRLALPSSWLLAPAVEDAGRDLARGEADYRELVHSIDDGLTLALDVAGATGPRRWLIAAANAAEMRGAGGMVLSYAVIEGEAGRISIGRVGPEEELNEPLGDDGAAVDLPADYVRRYERYNLTGDVRNATLSADFTVGAPVIEAIYEQATGESIDGVIQVDSMALARLVEVVGPAEVDGVGEISADSVVDLTLHDLYRHYDVNADRQDALASVAAAIVDLVFDSDPDPTDLLSALADSVAARNLMLYSSEDPVQESIRSLGADGSLPTGASTVHLAVQNFSGNKLDYFVDTALDITGRWPVGEDGVMTATVTVANRAPVGAADPEYVYGPIDASLAPGQYRGHVVLYLPPGVDVVEGPSGSGVSDVVVGTEHGRPLVTFAADVSAGETVRVEIDVAFPATDCPQLTLVPSPRVRPTMFDIDIEVGTASGTLEYADVLTTSRRLGGRC